MSEADSRPRSTTFSAITTVGSQVAIAALGLANVIVIGRALGPSGRGGVAFLTTVGFISCWLATLGVDQSVSNIGAVRPAARGALATNAVILAGLFGGAAAAIVIGASALFPDLQGPASRTMLIVVMLNVPLLVLQVFLRQLAAAQYHFSVGNLTEVAPGIVNIGVNALLLAIGHLTVTSAVITWLAGQALGTAWLCWYLQRRLHGFERPDSALAVESVKFGLRAYTSHAMNLGNYRADQWIMGILSTPAQLGLYSVAVAWSEALFMVPQAMSQIQRPDLARGRREDTGLRAAPIFRLSVVVTAVLSLGLIVLAPVLCVTVFGSSFEGSVVDLRILALGGFGVVALKLLGSALTAQGRPLREAFAVVISLVVVLALDFILIPDMGGEGASIASAVGYSVGGAAMVAVFCRTFDFSPRRLVPSGATLREGWAVARDLRTRMRPNGAT